MMDNKILRLIPKHSNLNDENLLKVCVINTTLGEMIAISDENYLYMLDFLDGKKIEKKIEQLKSITSKELVIGDNSINKTVTKEINEYFEGKRESFSVSFKFVGTDFQKECWTEMMKISYGDTVSYGEIATRLGKNSTFSRAVGGSAGANALLIIVPCHRIVASKGNLGGFGPGKDRKLFLMNHENKHKQKCK